MGASNSHNDVPSTMSISTNEQETGACLYSEDVCSTKDQEQRTHVGTSAYKEDQPRSQVHIFLAGEKDIYFIANFTLQLWRAGSESLRDLEDRRILGSKANGTRPIQYTTT